MQRPLRAPREVAGRRPARSTRDVPGVSGKETHLGAAPAQNRQRPPIGKSELDEGEQSGEPHEPRLGAVYPDRSRQSLADAHRSLMPGLMSDAVEDPSTQAMARAAAQLLEDLRRRCRPEEAVRQPEAHVDSLLKLALSRPLDEQAPVDPFEV